MPIYSGDEEVSDAESTSSEQHKYEAVELCYECDETEDNCLCDNEEKEFYDCGECVICGMEEFDSAHTEA